MIYSLQICSMLFLFCGMHHLDAFQFPNVADPVDLRFYADPFISSTEFKGKVFLFPWDESSRKGDFFFNQGFCTNNNAEMVSIHSAEENTFFRKFINRLGSTYGNIHPGVWLGAAIENLSKSFLWKNGQPANYYNWSPYDPNESDYSCLLTGWDGTDKWQDYYCTNKSLFVACQRKVSA